MGGWSINPGFAGLGWLELVRAATSLLVGRLFRDNDEPSATWTRPANRLYYADRLTVQAACLYTLTVQAAATGRAITVTYGEWTILKCCDGPRSLRAHAERICRVVPSGGDSVATRNPRHAYEAITGRFRSMLVRAVERALRRMVGQGLMLSHSVLLLGLEADLQSGSQPGIGAIAVSTRSSPAGLTRCLRSYAAHLQAHGRASELLICDDGGCGNRRDRLATILRGWSGVVYYADARQRREYAVRIAELAGLDPNLVLWAVADSDTASRIHPSTTRNFFLLALGGERYLQVQPSNECWPSEWEADQGIDEFGEHERVLGSPVQSLLTAGGRAAQVRCDAVDAFDQRGIQTGQATVAVTMSPVANGSCTGTPGWSADQWRQVGRYGGAATSVRTASLTWDSVQPELVIARSPLHCGSTIGYDLTRCLPPFCPVGAGDTDAFAEVMLACCPHRYTALLPHRLSDGGGGQWTGRNVPCLPSVAIHLSDLVLACIDAAAPDGVVDRRPRMVWFGRLLRMSGALTWRDLELQVLPVLRTRWRHQSDACRALLRTFGQGSVEWGALERCVVTLEERIKRDTLDPPVDIASAADSNQVRDKTLRLIARYGELLEAWPRLFATARDLRRRGEVTFTRGC